MCGWSSPCACTATMSVLMGFSLMSSAITVCVYVYCRALRSSLAPPVVHAALHVSFVNTRSTQQARCPCGCAVLTHSHPVPGVRDLPFESAFKPTQLCGWSHHITTRRLHPLWWSLVPLVSCHICTLLVVTARAQQYVRWPSLWRRYNVLYCITS